MGNKNQLSNDEWFNYFTDRSSKLAPEISKKTNELNRCRARIKDLESMRYENDHLDNPQPTAQEKKELIYLMGRVSYLENEIRNLIKQKNSCDKKLRDLQSQIIEDECTKEQ